MMDRESEQELYPDEERIRELENQIREAEQPEEAREETGPDILIFPQRAADAYEEQQPEDHSRVNETYEAPAGENPSDGYGNREEAEPQPVPLFTEKAPRSKPTKKRRKRRGVRLTGQLLRRIGILVLVVAAAMGAKLLLDLRTAKSYKIVETLPKESSSSAEYLSFAGGVFHYSSDGASLANTDQTIVWNETYDMNTPTVDASEDCIVVYDYKGSVIKAFNSKGLLGTVNTEYPILKARASDAGMIAAILEDGETTWINFYAANGTVIATGKTRIDNPGYPVDLDVSEDGTLLMISYLYIEGSTPTSYVCFYNFGKAGQNQMDNMVSGYTYADLMVPQVTFLDKSTAVAVCDDGLIVYTGGDIPAQTMRMQADSEIASSFILGDKVGLVTRTGNEEKPYLMTMYNTSGKKITEKNFAINYTTIAVNNGQILMYNDSQLSVFDDRGKEKFHGAIEEGAIQSVNRIGSNRYMVVLGDRIEIIRIK